MEWNARQTGSEPTMWNRVNGKNIECRRMRGNNSHQKSIHHLLDYIAVQLPYLPLHNKTLSHL